MSDIIKEAAEEIEEIFTPKPGGMIDRHRQERAKKEAAAEEAINESERIEAPSYKAVKTINQSPESMSAQGYNVPQGGRQLLLPDNPYRHRAIIQIQTNTGSGYICKDEGSCVSLNGYLLGNFQPLIIETRGQVWFQNNFGGMCLVYVLAEFYAPEKA